MDLLREQIAKHGKNLGNGILKVDSFMNHQIDPLLMRFIGEEFAKRFRSLQASKILTAETSGIAPALCTAMSLGIPLIYARKNLPKTMTGEPFRQTSVSPTHGKNVEFFVSSEYLRADERILIIDDFLASAQTILALKSMVEQSGASLVGIGAVIEKAFQDGRAKLSDVTVPIETLAVIQSMDGDSIQLG